MEFELISFFNITRFADAVGQSVSLIQIMVDEGYIQYAKTSDDGERLFSAEQAEKFPDVYEKYMYDHNINNYSISKNQPYINDIDNKEEPQLEYRLPEQQQGDSLITERVMEDADINVRQLEEIQKAIESELMMDEINNQRIEELKRRFNIEYKAQIKRWSLEAKYKAEEDIAREKRLQEEIRRKEYYNDRESIISDPNKTNEDTSTVYNHDFYNKSEAQSSEPFVSEFEKQQEVYRNEYDRQQQKIAEENRIKKQNENIEAYNKKVEEANNHNSSIGNKHIDFSGKGEHLEKINENSESLNPDSSRAGNLNNQFNQPQNPVYTQTLKDSERYRDSDLLDYSGHYKSPHPAPIKELDVNPEAIVNTDAFNITSSYNQPIDHKPSDNYKPSDVHEPSDNYKPSDAHKPSDSYKPSDTQKPSSPSNSVDNSTVKTKTSYTHTSYDNTKPQNAKVLGSGSDIKEETTPTSGIRLKKSDPYFSNLLIQRDVAQKREGNVVAILINNPRPNSSIARISPSVAKTTITPTVKNHVKQYMQAKNNPAYFKESKTHQIDSNAIIKEIRFINSNKKTKFNGQLLQTVGNITTRSVDAINDSDMGRGARHVKAVGENLFAAMNTVGCRPMFYHQLGLLSGRTDFYLNKYDKSPIFSNNDINKINNVLKERKIINKEHIGISFQYKKDLRMNMDMLDRYFKSRGFGPISNMSTRKLKIAIKSGGSMYNANDKALLEAMLKMKPAASTLKILDKHKFGLARGIKNKAFKLYGDSDVFQGLNLTTNTIKSVKHTLYNTKMALYYMGKGTNILGKGAYKTLKFIGKRTPAKRLVTKSAAYLKTTNPYRVASSARRKALNKRQDHIIKRNDKMIRRGARKDLKYQNSKILALKDRIRHSAIGTRVGAIFARINNMAIFKAIRGVNALQQLINKLKFKLMMYLGAAVLSIILISQILGVISGSLSSVTSFFSFFFGATEEEKQDPMNSFAGQAIKALSDKYDIWHTEVAANAANIQPSVNTSWQSINYRYFNSSGVETPVPVNNTKEILSMATVYMQFDNLNDVALKDYSLQLWDASHTVNYDPSVITYCPGCETRTVLNPYPIPDPDNPNELIDEYIEESYCPGHQSLDVNITTITFDGTNSLFVIDPVGSLPDASRQWDGWTKDNKEAVGFVFGTDWYKLYGINLIGGSTDSAISQEQINEIIAGINESDDIRKNIAEFALSTVGNIPYYWGGKASYAGWDNNNFGTTIAPDSKGRTLKGLDCSGLVNWIYWTTTGNNIGQSSTEFIKYYGIYSTDWSQIKTGDILWRGHYTYDSQGKRTWAGHVGIYIDKNTIVHTPGEPVNTVIVDDFNKSSWYGFIVIPR